MRANASRSQTAALINHIQIDLDFEIDVHADERRGHAFLQWGLVVIVGSGELSGTLACGGARRASLREGSWGVAGAEPMSRVPAGPQLGELRLSQL